MKTKHSLMLTSLLAITANGYGQGTFIYDQQSSDESNVVAPGGGAGINQAAMPGQSFIPALSSIGFIRLFIRDENTQDALGGIFVVNLRSDSINGPILASTTPVTLPDSTYGTANFFFNNPVVVPPGTTYYFGIVRQSGADSWAVNHASYNYSRGTFYLTGSPYSFADHDLWFREGIVGVPEPSTGWLILLGSGALFYVHRKRIHKQSPS